MENFHIKIFNFSQNCLSYWYKLQAEKKVLKCGLFCLYRVNVKVSIFYKQLTRVLLYTTLTEVLNDISNKISKLLKFIIYLVSTYFSQISFVMDMKLASITNTYFRNFDQIHYFFLTGCWSLNFTVKENTCTYV